MELGQRYDARIDVWIKFNDGPDVTLPPPLSLALSELNATLGLIVRARPSGEAERG